MIKKYKIEGMTCSSCVEKVKKQLESKEEISEAQIQLTEPQATLKLVGMLDVSDLQAILAEVGNYKISTL